MSILSSIFSARSGILAAQASIDVVSRNIANASTEGYSRKIQEQSSQVVGGVSQGVELEDVTRSVNEFLLKDVRQQTSVTGEVEALDEFMSRLELIFGRPEDASSFSAQITELKDAWQQLATSPDEPTRQQEVVRVAGTLVDSFASASSQIQDLRDEVDERIADAVTIVNNAVNNIDTLNSEIANRLAQGSEVADLLDQRDILVNQISEQMSVQVIERPNGQLTLLTGGGRLLLDETVFPLEFSATATFAPATDGNPLRIEDGFSTPATNPDISAEVTANDGRISGLLQLRDTNLRRAQDQIDSLAFQLATDFSTITGLTGGTTADLNLFVVEGTQAVPVAGDLEGFSANIVVRDAIETTTTLLLDPAGGTFNQNGVGDGTLAFAVIDIFESNRTFTTTVDGRTIDLSATGSTFEGFGAQIIGFQANLRAEFQTQFNFQNNFLDTLDQRLRDESGVNIDEEMAKLIELENAFAASARVLTTVQTALDELLNILR